MRQLGRRVSQREADDPLGDLRSQWLDPGGAGLVAQQPVDVLVHEALLPAPDAGL
jgi:hypothetical protein